MWDWEVFLRYLGARELLFAARTTVWLTVVAMACGVIVGVGLALCGISRSRPLRAVPAAYVWLFRGTPLLVQLLFLYLGLPQLGIRLSVLQAAVLGLSLHEAAYVSEILRAGLLAVDRGQTDAARALGLSGGQALRFVIFPQAARVIIPPLGNNFNQMLRTTSIVSVISYVELLRTTQDLINLTFRPIELYTVAALYYLTLTTMWNGIQRVIERFYGRGDTVAGQTMRSALERV